MDAMSHPNPQIAQKMNHESHNSKKCEKCRADVNDSALFCPRCGTKIQRMCDECGSVVADVDLFCYKCGASLSNFQSVPKETFLNVAKAVAHRMNNALSIVLTNSQIAMRQIAELIPETNEELRVRLEDIATAADGGGVVVRQFQRFLDSLANGRLEMESSVLYAGQLIGNLQVPARTETQVFYANGTSMKPTRVGRVSILIVDDEEKMRHALSYSLSLAGHHVITASDGEEALALFQNGSYDAAFVDLKMQGMSGWEVCSAIKQIDSDTTVVLMTGWSIKLDDERLKKYSVDAVLTKPFELSQINDLIRMTGDGATDH